ncbi:hypothetical protein [Paraburkholderia sacchari]
MFDAEIATKLLNRATSVGSEGDCERYLDVLREGSLSFSHRIARVVVDDSSSDLPLEVELLTFCDESQALRIRTGNVNASWSEWASTIQVGGPQSLATTSKCQSWPQDVERLTSSDWYQK